jgi:hypothetical protein
MVCLKQLPYVKLVFQTEWNFLHLLTTVQDSRTSSRPMERHGHNHPVSYKGLLCLAQTGKPPPPGGLVPCSAKIRPPELARLLYEVLKRDYEIRVRVATVMQAINFCIEDTHGCSDICNYTGPGTFDCLCTDPLATLSGKTCNCPVGYLGNSRTCTSINQCVDNTHDCEDQCACSNPDAYLADNDCHCNQGYSGNGLTCLGIIFFAIFIFFLLMTCLAINYCTEDTHGCSDVCNVTGPGTFDCLCTDPLATLSGKTCICPNGYSGNGRNCTVINYCLGNTHGCQDICDFIGLGVYQCNCHDPNAYPVKNTAFVQEDIILMALPVMQLICVLKTLILVKTFVFTL